MDTLLFRFASVRRRTLIFGAWAGGCVVYMIAMISTVYDGVPSMIFQPIMAALVSALCVAACFVLGLVFKIPAVGKIWSTTRWMAIGLGIASVFFMRYGSLLG